MGNLKVTHANVLGVDIGGWRSPEAMAASVLSGEAWFLDGDTVRFANSGEEILRHEYAVRVQGMSEPALVAGSWDDAMFLVRAHRYEGRRAWVDARVVGLNEGGKI